MAETEELPQRRSRGPRGPRGPRRRGRGRGPRRGPPSYSKNVVVILGIPDGDQLEHVRATASEFGEIVDAECRVTRNDNYLYVIEFADEAAATAAVNTMQFGDDTSVAFKRLPRERENLPRGEGDPTLVYVANTGTLSEEELRAILGGAIEEINRRPNSRFAFVRFANEDDAKAALSRNGYQLADGSALTVEPHRPVIAPAPQEQGEQRERRPPPQPEEGKVDPLRVAISGTPDVEDEELKEVLAGVGNVTRFLRRTRRTAFVNFETPEGAAAAVALDGQNLPSGAGPINVRPYVSVPRSRSKSSNSNNNGNNNANGNARRRALPANTVYVGNIDGLNDDAVKGFFAGEITGYDRRRGDSALVTFATEEDAEVALEQNDVSLSDEVNLVVSKELPARRRRRGPRKRVFVAGYPENVTLEDFQGVFPGVQAVRTRGRSSVLTFDTVENAEAAVAHNGEELMGEGPLRVEFMRK